MMSERVAALMGIWQVEDDEYEVYASEEGGFLAKSVATGEAISPPWVMLRGRKIADPQ